MELDPQRAGRATNAAAVTQQWFSQPIFAGIDLDDDAPVQEKGTAGKAGSAAEASGKLNGEASAVSLDINVETPAQPGCSIAIRA